MTTLNIQMVNVRNLTDFQLYKMCRTFGQTALHARNRFIGLLPEVNRRKLYAKKFTSLSHFAAVLGGVSEEQVKTVLNLHRQFENLLTLRRLLVSGTASINKLARIVTVVTPENEKYWALQVQTLSKSALEVLVRDFKAACEEARKTENSGDVMCASSDQSSLWKNEYSSTEAKNQESILPGQPKAHSDINTNVTGQIGKAVFSDEPNLSPEIKRQLCELERKEIDINALIQAALDERIAKIEQKKSTIAQNIQETTSRHIPVETMRVVKEEFGTKCAARNCTKKSAQVHHTNRYSMSKNHNPHYLAPLCNEHHQIAHSVDIKSLEARARKFILQK